MMKNYCAIYAEVSCERRIMLANSWWMRITRQIGAKTLCRPSSDGRLGRESVVGNENQEMLDRNDRGARENKQYSMSLYCTWLYVNSPLYRYGAEQMGTRALSGRMTWKNIRLERLRWLSRGKWEQTEMKKIVFVANRKLGKPGKPGKPEIRIFVIAGDLIEETLLSMVKSPKHVVVEYWCVYPNPQREWRHR